MTGFNKREDRPNGPRCEDPNSTIENKRCSFKCPPCPSSFPTLTCYNPNRMDALRLTPLPANHFNVATNQDWHRAFNSCRRLEAADRWATFSHDLEEIMLHTNPQVAARTLGYALVFAPSDVGRDCVAREVNACHDDPEILAGLAHLYMYGLIRICQCMSSVSDFWCLQGKSVKNPKGPTPAMSSNMSPEVTFGATVEDHSPTMISPGTAPPWLKDQASSILVFALCNLC